MKQGWEIKKLGEVCKIQTGKLDANAKVDNGEYPFFTCDSKPYKIDKYAFDDEAILISGNGSLVGHVNYYKGKFNAYQRTYVLTKFNSFHLPFLICFLKRYLRPYIVENKKGGCIPYITLPILQSFSIPCPPLPEQEKIVSELDCLSGIIEKKRQQLKELDALAQSIFYEMFGDPVTNEKGWEVKKLGEVASDIFAGGDKPKDISDVQTEEYAYPVYANGDGAKGLLGYSRKYRVASKAVTIGARGASIGNCRICNERFTPVVRLITIVPGEDLNIIFLYHSALKMEFDINGAGQAQLTIPNVVSKSIILPPLPLQQTFASKIEAIEKQKALIKQSLGEVETLFNARMQEYFD